MAPMLRTLALAVVVVALAGASTASAKVGDLYALRYGAQLNLLVPYDPVRLVPSGRAIDVGHFAQAWSLSPDRTRFVAAAGWRKTRGEPTSLRFVDLDEWPNRGDVEVARRAQARRRDRVGARPRARGGVGRGGDDCLLGRSGSARSVVGKAEAPGNVVVGVRSHNGVALLLETAGSDRAGHARIRRPEAAAENGRARTDHRRIRRQRHRRRSLFDRAAARPHARSVGGPCLRFRRRRARRCGRPAARWQWSTRRSACSQRSGRTARARCARRRRCRTAASSSPATASEGGNNVPARGRPEGLVEPSARPQLAVVPRRRRDDLHPPRRHAGASDVEALRRRSSTCSRPARSATSSSTARARSSRSSARTRRPRSSSSAPAGSSGTRFLRIR